jgi:hypothetical protein
MLWTYFHDYYITLGGYTTACVNKIVGSRIGTLTWETTYWTEVPPCLELGKARVGGGASVGVGGIEIPEREWAIQRRRLMRL